MAGSANPQNTQAGPPAATMGPRPPAPPNVYQQSAQALTGAQNTANRLSNFTPTNMGAAQLGAANTMQGVGQVGNVFAPGQINVDQLRSMDFSQYMNPYTQQVIDAGQSDIERQRLMASNQLGAQAQAAGAFGGSRQAIQEGVLAGEAARQAAQLSAQQRQAGFGQALQSGQFDINQTQSARSLQSQQGMQANVLNQQAEEAAAAREQAVRAGNMQAANAFATQQAQFEQQANATNYGGQFNAANIQAGAANQLGNLSQTGFGFGQQIGQQQAQRGLMQQGLQQALIDAARGQYAGAVGAPNASLGLPFAALGATPNQSTTTQTKNPGLFDYLALGASILPSDTRLKTNITPRGTKGGINFYSWDWNDEGKRIADPDQPTFGVMAQELQATHPHLVKRGGDGYLRVNYGGLAAEMGAA